MREAKLTFETLFQYGKREYTNHNWRDCVAFMLSAIEDFNYFVGEIEWCRRKCLKVIETRKLKDLLVEDEDNFDIAYMYGQAQQALCLFRCKTDQFTEQRPPLLNSFVFEEFQHRKPYQYLQFCYWKAAESITRAISPSPIQSEAQPQLYINMGNLEQATKAAYTYLVGNPNDADSLQNVAFYMEQKDFKEEMLIDAMRMPGVAAYNEKDYLNCIGHLKAATDEFYAEEEKCRRICEDKLNWDTIDGVNPEMAIILTSVYTSVLRCKNNCAKQLSVINGHNEGFLLSKIFEYLHVCQYNMKQGRDACQSVANSILLNPNNPVMRQNKHFYMKIYEQDDLFEPSPEVVKFYKRDAMERLYIDFVDERFKYENGELPPEREDDVMAMKVDFAVDDSFDYHSLDYELISEAECNALNVAAIFEKQHLPQVHAVQDLQTKLSQRYGMELQFMVLSCTDQKPLPKCNNSLIIISVDKNQCGTLLSHRNPNGCTVIYCAQ
uniref:Procollagen-proline 3-dioxygenase n=1 Tax=Syphacia muris TaxID=451379 RepID=A0A0N5AUK3_9BILA